MLSTQKAAEVRSQPSLAFLDCLSVVTGGRVPVVREVSLERCRTKAGRDKEEEPPQSRSLWMPYSRCELSLFLFPWFLPPRPHRQGHDGQVHSLRNHWHEKRRKSPKRASVLKHFFIARVLHSYGAERKITLCLINHTFCAQLPMCISVHFGFRNNTLFALKSKIIIQTFLLLCSQRWLSTLQKILFLETFGTQSTECQGSFAGSSE